MGTITPSTPLREGFTAKPATGSGWVADGSRPLLRGPAGYLPVRETSRFDQ